MLYKKTGFLGNFISHKARRYASKQIINKEIISYLPLFLPALVKIENKRNRGKAENAQTDNSCVFAKCNYIVFVGVFVCVCVFPCVCVFAW